MTKFNYKKNSANSKTIASRKYRAAAIKKAEHKALDNLFSLLSSDLVNKIIECMEESKDFYDTPKAIKQINDTITIAKEHC